MKPSNFLEMVGVARHTGAASQIACRYAYGPGGLFRLWYSPAHDTCVMGYEVRAHHADPSKQHNHTVHTYPRAEYDNPADWCDAVLTAWEDLTND